MGIASYRTNKGALVATIEGENTDKEITLSGHVDTLGGMVKEIKSDGRLKLTQIGGYVWSTVEGEYVTIETLEGKNTREPYLRQQPLPMFTEVKLKP